jgi:hypothetical protein
MTTDSAPGSSGNGGSGGSGNGNGGNGNGNGGNGGGLPDFRIHDLASFNNVTGEGHEIAGLYFYQQLDCLVDLAYKLSCDFFNRPESYTDVGGLSLSQALATLHARYGSNETLPSDSQRDAIFLPIFGKGGERTLPPGVSPKQEKGDFPPLRDDLLKSAQAFAERAVDTGIDMLRARIRDALRVTKDYLDGLEGDSVKWSRLNALPTLTENFSYTFLRSTKIAAVFGTAPATNDFPYVEQASGHKLVENIWKQLAGDETPTLNRNRISSLQRAALRGAEAIAAIISFQEDLDNTDLDKITEALYKWDAALWAAKASATGAVSPPATGMGSAYSAPTK